MSGAADDVRTPSGRQPSAAGSDRISHSVVGTMPTNQARANHGAVSARPLRSSSHFATGVTTMPPTDKPVLATDSATDRRAWNHRVTTVVAGTRPAKVCPIDSNTYTPYTCHTSDTCPSSNSATAPTTAPIVMTTWTSRATIRRATSSPDTPLTTKNNVTAAEIEPTLQPCSRDRTVRKTARP